MMGRHRLSGVWKADPKASLPILSDHLLYEDSIEVMGEEFEQGFYLSSKSECSISPRIPLSGHGQPPISSVLNTMHGRRQRLPMPSIKSN